LPTQFEALIRDVRTTLGNNLHLAIFGWHAKFHNEFTEKFLTSKSIIFFARIPRKLGESIGYGVTTKCTGHTQLQGVKHKIPIYPHVLSKTEVKEILKACEDLLIHPCEHATHGPPNSTAELATHAVAEEIILANGVLLEILTKPRRPAMISIEDQAMLPFVTAYTEKAAQARKKGRVGIKTFSTLLKDCGVGQTQLQLIRDGWVIKGKELGSKKSGWYEAGPKMLAVIEATPPDDPCECAQWLIARKPAALKKKAGIQARLDTELAAVRARFAAEESKVNADFSDELAQAEKELAEIAVVETAFSQLKAVLPKK
jgi:hypothetical protein